MKPCACGTPEPPHTCGWKHKAEFLIPAGHVIKGDRIQVGIAFMPVTGVHVTQPSKKLWRKNKYEDRPAVIEITTAIGPREAKLTTPVLVRRVGLCGAACCDKCAREVSELKHICRAHWDAWEHREALDQSLEAYDG